MAYQPLIVVNSGSYHDEIRAQLGVDDSVLADTDIDSVSVLGLGEGYVIARVPDYATLTGVDANLVYSAAIMSTASVIAPSMSARLKASEGDSDYKYTNQNVDWKSRQQALMDGAYSLMDLISTQTVVELTLVGVAGPTTLKQQQMAAKGESGFITPDAGDISLYPTNQE